MVTEELSHAQPWTEEQVRGLLERENPDYQRIELPYGLATAGSDRSPLYNKIFAEDLAGKSVLDIGCKLGAFCFEALKRGASRVVGVDVDPHSIRKARLLADCLGLRAEFRLLDIDLDPLSEQFDYVLCLNVLHHLKNPLAVLPKLVGATKERLVLETAALGKHDRKKLGISFLQAYLLRRAPVMGIAAPAESSRGCSQRYFFSRRGMHNLLAAQGPWFAGVQSFTSDFKDRFVTLARRRQIKRVLVVAGPTSSGKSTFIRRLVKGELPEIAARLQFDDPEKWDYATANQLAQRGAASIERLLFHYDILRLQRTDAKTYDRDPVLNLVGVAERVTFLTLSEPSEVLNRQLVQGEIQPKMRGGRYRGSSYYLHLQKQYADPALVAEIYERWFDFCKTCKGEHFILSMSEGGRLCQLDEWRQCHAA